jgi:hypothetical protein
MERNVSNSSYIMVYERPQASGLTPGQLSYLTIGFVSIFTSLVNILVFASPNLKDKTYKFLLITSVFDVLYLMMVFFTELFQKYCSYNPLACGSSAQYASYATVIALNYYVTSCFAIYSIFSEVFLTLQRLLMLRKIKFLQNATLPLVVPLLLIASFLYYTPALFVERIVLTGNIYVYDSKMYEEYALVPTEFAVKYGGVMLVVLSTIRMCLVMIVLSVLNAVSIFSFKKFLANKSKIVARKKCKYNPNKCVYS